MSEDASSDSTDEPVGESTDPTAPSSDPGGVVPATDGEFHGLGTAVGAFLVLGVGFVFTFFFVSQFAGESGGFGTGVGIGGSGLGFAVLLSPLLALFVGVLVGRDDDPSAVRDAGVGSALGFVVMYFVTLVVASSLQAGAAPGGNSLGPLVGFTVGVGLTGAAAAAVTRYDAGVSGTLDDYAVAGPVAFGVGAFGVFAVGYAVSVFLADVVASGGTAGGGFGLFTGSVIGTLVLGLLFAPLIGLLVGVFVARKTDTADSLEVTVGGGLAGALGAACVLLVFYAIVLVVEPGGVPAGDFPAGLLVGLVVGTGLTGGGAAYVGATQ